MREVSLVGMDGGRGSIDDEEEPEQLVATLKDDMLPHAAADQGLTAPMGLVKQQLRGRIFSCQGCRHTQMLMLSSKCQAKVKTLVSRAAQKCSTLRVCLHQWNPIT